MEQVIRQQLKDAANAKTRLAVLETKDKNLALKKIQDTLLAHIDQIVEENNKDIDNARITGLSEAMIDRLLLDESRIKAMVQDIQKVIELEDPIGQKVREIHKDNGLEIQQIRVPIGVIGVIYESRPNVTIDIASLCIKSGNVCVLKGGKEAFYSNMVLTKLMVEATLDILGKDAIIYIETSSRQDVDILLQAKEYLDLLIPRGSATLIQHVTKNSLVPVIETGAGVCHLFVDKDADLEKAKAIALNGKVQRPSVCNALETIIVHQAIAKEFLELLYDAFIKEEVKMYGCSKTKSFIQCFLINEDSYSTEYGSKACNIKVVDHFEEAIAHIQQFSTKHSEAIVSENMERCELFLNQVDSACVYANASTRFSDGGEFGFGVEVGISTQKLHARGPMGLQEITTTKYKIYGRGQIR